MGVTDRYRSVADMPEVLAVFPLRGAILLPRASLTLNVFEPRYLALVDHALAGDRMIGVLQPGPEAGNVESPTGKTFPLRRVGCAGRITSFTESEDGRVVIALAGLARFAVGPEIEHGIVGLLGAAFHGRQQAATLLVAVVELPEERDHLFEVEGLAGLTDHEGAHPLHEDRVGHGDTGHGGDLGVAE